MSRRLRNTLLSTFSVLGAFGSIQLASAADYEFDRAQDGIIFFKNQKSIKTGLTEIKVYGILKPQDASQLPYVLFSGRTCSNCEQDTALFLYRVDRQFSTHFVFPGKVIDPKMGQLVYDSKAYFGKCLADRGEVYYVNQKERVDKKNRLKQSVFILEPASPYPKETLLERGFPNDRFLQKALKQKTCFEIAGRSRTALKKPLDLKPRNTEEEEDDDEEETTAEGQAANPTQTPAPAPTNSP